MMMRILILAVLFVLSARSSVSAQAVIKILQFEKNTGIIDRGEQDGVRLGDVFEVNRYAGDFVYWVGRVEVILVKPKMAGIKLLEQAGDRAIQKGDVLEPRKREFDPMQEKLSQSIVPVENGASNNSSPQGQSEAQRPAPGLSGRRRALHFGLTLGLSQSLNRSSESLGQHLTLQIRDQENRLLDTIDMTHAYTTSTALQAFCTLPLSGQFSVNLNFAYLPLNVKGGVESELLDVGMMASASLMKINSSLNYRVNERWQIGVGVGLFLPQLTITGGGQSLTVSDRHFGIAAELAHFLPLGSRVWLKSMLEYDLFLDDGPSIQSLSIQTGPSFTIGRR